jgi:hypothetical protein
MIRKKFLSLHLSLTSALLTHKLARETPRFGEECGKFFFTVFPFSVGLVLRTHKKRAQKSLTTDGVVRVCALCPPKKRSFHPENHAPKRWRNKWLS